MHSFKQKILIAVVVTFGFGVSTLLYAAYTVPSDLACLFLKSATLDKLPDGALVDPGISDAERATFPELQWQAKARIEKIFGAPRVLPIVVFFKDSKIFWPLKINSYGSAGSAINHHCVFMGPQGLNVDVVAHELMHQELQERVGSWRMFTEVPVWFNEGIAMQVDFRPQYSLAPEAANPGDIGKVRTLKSVRQFNQGNDAQLTQHYAFAKAEVAQWLSQVGQRDLYPRLERIRAGEPFHTVVERKQPSGMAPQ